MTVPNLSKIRHFSIETEATVFRVPLFVGNPDINQHRSFRFFCRSVTDQRCLRPLPVFQLMRSEKAPGSGSCNNASLCHRYEAANFHFSLGF